MKLGVTTLGCPGWTLQEILLRVKQYGYDGVELRGLGPSLDLTDAPEFASTDAILRTRQQFADSGLEIIGLDSSAHLSSSEPAERERNMAHARSMIDLAHSLGAGCVRVFGGGLPDGVSRETVAGWIADGLTELGDYADNRTESKVSIVLESHDAFSTGRQVADVLMRVKQLSVGALWDMHHPFRQGESPDETFEALAPYIKHVHLKDSKPDSGYCLLGEGDIPIREMLVLLKRFGYTGYLSVEWEKRWIPTLLEPEIAFKQYAAKLREYLGEIS